MRSMQRADYSIKLQILLNYTFATKLIIIMLIRLEEALDKV